MKASEIGMAVFLIGLLIGSIRIWWEVRKDSRIIRPPLNKQYFILDKKDYPKRKKPLS